MVQILRRDVSMLERRMETAESIGDHGVLRKRKGRQRSRRHTELQSWIGTSCTVVLKASMWHMHAQVWQLRLSICRDV